MKHWRERGIAVNEGAAGGTADYDVVIIGAGPAGLSAALNLVRARRRTVVLDSNRPRHSAALVSHGFLTRDNTPPHELRRLGREEYLAYPEAEAQLATVKSIVSLAAPRSQVYASDTHTTGAIGLFEVSAKGINSQPDRLVRARTVLHATVLHATVLHATVLTEELPALPSIRSFYGMGLFSCVACDGYEYSDRPITRSPSSARPRMSPGVPCSSPSGATISRSSPMGRMPSPQDRRLCWPSAA